VTGDREIVVVGSQAILGQFPDAPEALLLSQELDVYPLNRPEKAVEVDGALGDGSPFHESFGYYAHGVGPETAKAPAGWEARLIGVRMPMRPGRDEEVVGWCLEVHDLVLAKSVAGRGRDWEFAELALRHALVEPEELLERAADLPLADDRREAIRQMLRGIIARA